MPNAEEAVIDDVTCTVCACLCGDWRVLIREGRIVRAEGACSLAEPWFLQQESRQPPVAAINGIPVTLEEAVVHATRILDHAHAPLIYGLSHSLGHRPRDTERKETDEGRDGKAAPCSHSWRGLWRAVCG